MRLSRLSSLKLASGAAIALCVAAMSPANAWDCSTVPGYGALKWALDMAQAQKNGGFGFTMWGTIVDRDGTVCAVAFTGSDRGEQWPGSRVVSAQKAYTANPFSLPKFARSTANLYAAVQPGGSLYGLQHSNPVDPALAYLGPASDFGTSKDPMVGYRVGGVNVFGGGLALYDSSGTLVGAIGVSGDSSCADHNIAWETRNFLGLDHVPGGVSGDPSRPDNIVYDITSQPGQMPGISAKGWGHPACSPASTAVAAGLPTVSP